eukprot:568188-Prorocentrum_lima.AAC.1
MQKPTGSSGTYVMHHGCSSGFVAPGLQSTKSVEVEGCHSGRDPASSSKSPRPNFPDLSVQTGVSDSL